PSPYSTLFKNHVIKAHTSFGSHPQKRSQAICAQMAAKISPPKVNTGKPMATERYVISSNRSGFAFLTKGCIAAPSRFRNRSLNRIYNRVPVRKDQINVLNFLPASSTFIQPGV